MDPRTSSLRARIQRFLEAGIDPESADLATLRQVRLVSFSTVLMFTIAIPFVFQYVRLGVPMVAVGLLLTMIACVVNIALLRHMGNPTVSGHIAAGSLFSLLLLSNWASGGFYDPNFAWFYILPLGAALIISLRAGVIWTLIVLLTTVAFWLLPAFGVELENAIPAEQWAVQSLLNRISAVFAIAILTGCFIVIQRRTEISLNAANQALAEEVEERKKAEAEARAADDAKSEFLAMVSHEIRTPMNGILGMAGLLMDTELDETQRRFARTVRVSTESLLSIINEILDLAKIESGRLVLEPLDFDLDEALSEIVELLTPIARDKGLFIGWMRDNDVRRMQRGDLGRIRQVLINLIGNAIKFTERGGVEVSVTRNDASGGVVFEVADSGIGIPRALRDKIFAPFTQVDSSTTRRFGGTGLGLAIARKLTERLNGKLSVDSRVGVGSTFRFEVPLDEPVGDHPGTDEILREEMAQALARRQAEADDVAEEAAADAVTPPRNVPASDRLLIVEDNAINQKVLAAMLEKLGFRSDVAANGREAVEMLDQVGYRLVLMDCRMPVMDGYQATAEIRRREAGGTRTPIIALTANALPEDRERALATGMDEFLAKPLTFDMLRPILARWVGPVEDPFQESGQISEVATTSPADDEAT